MNFASRLDQCKNFGDVLEVVRKTTERSLGLRRAGLMLYLAELPRHIGAFHTLGTNGIVMNRKTLNMVTRTSGSLKLINSYVYSILLHEYLHALGVADESQVRELGRKIASEMFGSDHPATIMAAKGPGEFFPRLFEYDDAPAGRSPEVIADFDRSSRRYIT